MPRGRPKQFTEEERYQRKLEQGRRAGAKWRATNDRGPYHKEYDKNRSPAYKLKRSARQRALDSGIPWNIAEDDIVVTPNCPICGTEMRCSSQRGGTSSSPTLDKVRPELGYVKGNIAVICKLCNSTKGRGSSALHRKIAEYIDSF